MKRVITNLLVVLLTLSMFVSCTNTSNSSSSSKQSSNAGESSTEGSSDSTVPKEKIVFGMTRPSYGIFHPLLAVTSVDMGFNTILFPSLLAINESGELEPYFATSHEISEDGKTVTYHLNENAKWTDGTPVTSADVAFTFTSMSQKDFTGTGAANTDALKGVSEYREGASDTVSGITTPDDYTVVLEFETVAPASFTRLSTIGILAKHIWSEIPWQEWETQTELIQNPVGFGPYSLEEYEEGQTVSMKANPDFFEGAPVTESIIFKTVNPTTLSSEFKNKTIDLGIVKDIRTDEIVMLQDELSLENASFPDSNYQYIGINMRKPIFQDVNLRTALIYAIDRNSIVENVLEGRASVIDGPFLKTGWAYPEHLESYSYDIEKANAILDEAGYIDTDNDGIRENSDGEKLSFVFDYPSEDPTAEKIALSTQQSLKQIGIEVEPVLLARDVLMDKAIYNHDFDLYTFGCIIRIDPDLYTWWHSDSGKDEEGTPSWNFGHYSNERVDELIGLSNGTLDQDERSTYYNEIADIIHSEVPMLFLYSQSNEILYPKNMSGFAPSTFNEYYNIHLWEIFE